jgi:hypothetical protein
MVEKNSLGWLLLDIEKIAEELLQKRFTRYNGGWIKAVNSLNKSVTNGYSIVGDFARSGLNWNAPGLYIDCSIGGSRKHPEKVYSLFRLAPDGTAHLIFGVDNVRDWAPRMWPHIEKEFLPDAKPENLWPEDILTAPGLIEAAIGHAEGDEMNGHPRNAVQELKRIHAMFIEHGL